MKYSVLLSALICLVVLPSALPAAQSSATAQSSGRANLPRVDLNTGAETALASLPGVGQALAKTIVASRPYTSVDDLAKAGIPVKKIEQLRQFVKVADKSAAAPAELQRGPLPGPGITKIPVESGTVRVIPVPPGAVTPVEVKSNTVRSVEGGPGMTSVPREKTSDLVWADSTKKLFYREASASYGKGQSGAIMTEAAAVAAGYREAKVSAAPAKKTPDSKSKNP